MILSAMSAKGSNFIHLHNHSEYSLLDGLCRIENLVLRAKELQMPAVALTDHGSMYGAIEFYRQAVQEGIKPIIGCETYLAPLTRFDKKTKEDRSPFHLTLLAKNEVGYRNLIKLITLASLEGFYAKPRIDKEILFEHKEGLIVLSGCLVGEIPRLLLAGKESEALEVAGQFREVFLDDFYLEIMDQGLSEQKEVNPKIIQLSKEMNIPLVATNDVHYLLADQAKAQDVLLCIQTGKFVDEEKRMKFSADDFYFKSEAEMKALFSEVPAALTNTLEIMDKCNLEIEIGKNHLPDFPLPEEITPEKHLDHLSEEGLKRRYGPKMPPEIIQRAKHELNIIKTKGFASYFLIVQDFIHYAKEHGIPVGPGRGSAVGSVVAYALGITDIDPLKYGLLFERFLNPERTSLPDIDIDFCIERRGEVIEYVSQKYGTDKVAQIITFGRMAARAALKDVGRVFRFTFNEVDRVAKLIPQTPDMNIKKAMGLSKELKGLYDGDERIKLLIDMSLEIEGLKRHASQHAAGVVISKDDLTDRVPLRKVSGDQIVTQYAMGDLEKIGLLKMDFLGLRNLTMISDAVRLIKRSQGVEVDLLSLPLDDEKTYHLLSSGSTVGIFQLESRGMRALIKEMNPSSFEDIIALLSLYRPGPLESGMVDDFIARKHKKVVVKYDLPELEPILKETYGVIVYQEQVMRIASEIAGFSLGEADVLRAAMGKKKVKEMALQKEKFIQGAIERGISKNKAAHLFNLCSKFAGYGFNKSHSTSYSLISYQTAYLKANYPLEFMAALLNSVMGVTDKVSLYIKEARRMGIEILPPDINESELRFSVGQKGIRFGMMAVKNVGGAAAEEIMRKRESQGSYQSLADFLEKLDLRVVNKRVIESLIKCGAFDSLNEGRAPLLQRLERLLEKIQRQGRQKEKGQVALFNLSENKGMLNSDEVEVPEFPQDVLLRMEKEMLGLYISDHPLSHVKETLEKAVKTRIESLKHKGEGAVVVVGGILSACRKINTRRGGVMLTAHLEDLTGGISLVLFPQNYEKYAPYMINDALVIVRGKVDMRNDTLQIVVEDVKAFSEKGEQTKTLHIEMEKDSSMAVQLKQILEKNQGESPVYLHTEGRLIRTGRDLWVNIAPDLIQKVEAVAGSGSAWVETDG